MRLKKIEILGFKSFADKTVVEFSPGITAIVGPNGCGKSNIADAFRWVLGEQSAKSLRGNKMYDIIFAGTTKRAPLNIAEVTLTLTDIGDALPIEYDEISVTRRLHRNGDSQYFLNKQPVRLKDVQNLFLDSGLGKNAFAIFEQGKIDQVIQYSPLERRYIFEEAAGILRFLQRKREALHKLEQVDQNSVRVKDIHKEIERQIIVLEQQAAQARVYKENKSSLELLEKMLAVAKWEQLQQRLHDINKKESAQQQRLKEIKTELEELQNDRQEKKIHLSQSEQVLRSKSEDLFRIRSDQAIKTQEQQSQQQRLKENLVKEKRLSQELELLIEKKGSRQAERLKMQKEQEQLDQALIEHTRTLQGQRDNTRVLEEAVARLREQQQTSQQDRIRCVQLESQIESEIKQNSVRSDSLQERKMDLQGRKEKSLTRVEELKTGLEEKKIAMTVANKAVDDQKKAFVLLDQQTKKITDDLHASRGNLNTLQQEIAEIKARQKVLTRLREEKEGFSSGSKRLLLESANPKSPLHNVLHELYQLLSSQSGTEMALATALRLYTQTLVVKTRTEFQIVIDFARQNKLKDFSLLCLEDLQTPANSKAKTFEGIIPLLQQIADSPLGNHLLSDVFIADDLETAAKWHQTNPKSSVLTKDGIVVDAMGVVFFVSQGENNVFMREAELKTIQKKLDLLEKTRQELESNMKELQLQQEKIQSEKSILDKAIRRDEMTLVEVNFGVQRLTTELERSKNEEKQFEQELKNLTLSIEGLASKLKELTQQYQTAKTKSEQVKELSSRLQQDWDKQIAALKSERDALQGKEANYRKISDDSKKLTHALQILDVKDLESLEQEARLNDEIQRGKEFQAQVQKQGVLFEKALLDIEKSLEEASHKCTDIEKDVAKRKLAIESMDSKVETTRQQVTRTDEELYRLNTTKGQLQASLQTILDDLHEKYQLAIDAAHALFSQEQKQLEAPEQIERKIRKVRQEMESAGDVNMMSIEEFDKHQTRYDLLNRQIDDLESSKQELVEIITQLDGESRKIFKETFDLIRGHFQRNFQILFNGGEADLQFSEDSDVLEAGIEIIAKPPGKQMRSIQLLSGGEKCLTAMALLFAIFEVKPAPFCILDEIDAPLDDSNVERFANIVKQFEDRCQFMMITHNKRTMAIADMLCGVSMEERGVSKLIAIEFSKQNQLTSVHV